MSQIEWREDLNSVEWDVALARLGGHPLQSALWGDARRAVDRVRDHRWMALRTGKPVWMIRCEERAVPALGPIGWVPKGPAGETPSGAGALPSALIERLKPYGITALITNEWSQAGDQSGNTANGAAGPRTIWIDLSAGRDRVWENVDKQWRYGVRRAERLGVVVESTRSPPDIEEFFALCASISRVKSFRLPASVALMKCLLEREEGGAVEARLFVARHQGRLGAGAFLIRCGGSVHYFWGATDRALSKERVGEAVQWAAIEWALAKKCRCYDLEGIDPQYNPGVYEFKKKMGGREITLIGKQHYPLGIRGRLASWLDARFR
jgi:hypothetical protein